MVSDSIRFFDFILYGKSVTGFLVTKLSKEDAHMAEVTYKGKTFEVDEDGFLLKFDEWCPEWLEYVKESEGITDLNEDHQKILDFLQDYYRKNGIALVHPVQEHRLQAERSVRTLPLRPR